MKTNKKNDITERGVKRAFKSKRIVPARFDKEGFLMAWGIGIVCAGIGVLLVWATHTAPEGAAPSTGFTTAQRLARVLPESTKETLAFIIGGLFVLFGVFCIFLGLKLTFQYIFEKMRT